MKVTSKDPDAIEDFAVDWSARIGTDTISTSTWTVPSGITKVQDSKTTTTTTVRLSGGTVGSFYDCLNRIVLATSGQTLDFTLRVYIVQE